MSEQLDHQILVVDDEPSIVHLCTRILTREGYQVTSANSGEEAIEKAFAQPPDLVLLDVIMSGINGFEVCQRLKAEPATELVPVIILTALPHQKDKIAGLEAGASDFLTKPFDRIELLARVRNLLRIKRLTDQLERTESVIFALAEAVEAKDPYTRGHLERMGNLTEQLAQAAGIDAKQSPYIRFGGILHDVGKVGISEAILRKPGPLTPQERAEIEQHPIIGARIVQPLRFADVVAPIVRGHHERWDGKGYPDGLKGEKIPLGARVVALIDAYDAMCSDRPYRFALEPKSIRHELEHGSGSQFDPELTHILIKILEEEGSL